jgi:flavin-dependent dehydrogenase
MSSRDAISSIVEPARETPVFRETDVLFGGGGPAGIGAAIAAAALAVGNNQHPGDIDIQVLRPVLLEQGVYLP